MGYLPRTGDLVTRVALGIYASASLAISLGPVSGGVYGYFGVNVDYFARKGKSSELRIAIVLMFIGQVTLLGFISVSLSIGLQAEYRSTGGLVGRGWVSYSIKIGFFLEINVECAVEYHYGNPALPETDTSEEAYIKSAAAYLDAFYN
jgi:hypothetical protein